MTIPFSDASSRGPWLTPLDLRSSGTGGTSRAAATLQITIHAGPCGYELPLLSGGLDQQSAMVEFCSHEPESPGLVLHFSCLGNDLRTRRFSDGQAPGGCAKMLIVLAWSPCVAPALRSPSPPPSLQEMSFVVYPNFGAELRMEVGLALLPGLVDLIASLESTALELLQLQADSCIHQDSSQLSWQSMEESDTCQAEKEATVVAAVLVVMGPGSSTQCTTMSSSVVERAGIFVRAEQHHQYQLPGTTDQSLGIQVAGVGL